MEDEKNKLNQEPNSIEDGSNPKESIDRRDFLKKASLATIGGISLPFISFNSLKAQEDKDDEDEDTKKDNKEAEPESKNEDSSGSLATRDLGKLGKVSVITFGGNLITDSNVIKSALNMGVTCIDTAPGYYGGQSEETIGKFLKQNKDARKKIILSTKFKIDDEDPAYGGDENKMFSSLEKSLKRLNTDYVDIVYVHGVGGIHRVTNDKLHAAFDKAKKKGMVKHLGITCFNGDMKAVIKKAVEDGRFDVIQFYYNYIRRNDKYESKFFDYDKVISKAKEKKIGIIASEPFAGGFDVTKPDFKGKDFRGASIRWILKNENISSVSVPIRNYNELEQYVKAVSGGGSNDEGALSSYQKAVTEQWKHSYCRACDVCLPVCIFNVAVPDILRYRAQFENFGMEKKAILSYKALIDQNQAVYCETCSEPCKHVCPFGVDIKPSLVQAHKLLTL